MKLYHGSPTGGITTLTPHESEHGNRVFFTDNEDLALMYAGKPLWGTYYYKDGRLCYDEYYPGQLKDFFAGKSGYIYCCEVENVPQHEKMPWVYMSAEPVKVDGCRFVPDIYAELLSLIELGRIDFYPFESVPDKRRENTYAMLRRYFKERDLANKPDDPETIFAREHFPDLL